MRVLLILILILPYHLLGEDTKSKIKLEVLHPPIDVLYEECIKHLKEREGFRSNPYRCPAGQLTIGYGTKAKKLKEINGQQADSLLRRDFNKAINKVSKEFINYDCNKIYALAMLVHNVGFNKFKYNKNGYYTGLYLQLKNDKEPTNWLKYNKIENKKNKRLIKNRNYEYKIFHN